jgi:hypothetical protein
VKILQVQYPTSVTSGGTINVAVHVQAAFTNSPENGEYGFLIVSIANVDNNNAIISGTDVVVSTAAGSCLVGSSQKTTCLMMATQPWIDQTFIFTFSPSDVSSSSVLNLEALVGTMNECAGCSNPLQMASASFPFSVTVSQ